MRHHRALTPILSAALATFALAGPVDDEVNSFQRFTRAPGVSVAVMKDGKVVFAKGYGLANVETGTKATPQTVYRIGSVSKQFITTGIMLLEQEGKLSVDDKLSQHLNDTPAAWSEITLRHLMNHTSGLRRESPAFQPFEEVPLIDQITASFKEKLDFATGTKYQYCNLAYFILAHIIDKVSGQPWGDYITARVFRPNGMADSGLCDEFKIVMNRAKGYDASGAQLQNDPAFLAMRPSGAFHSTVLDMAKWDAALYGDSVLTAASKTKMWTSTPLVGGGVSDYGFGWGIGNPRGHRLVSHDGAQPGFRASFLRFVDDRVSVVVLVNESGSPAGLLANNIAEHYVPGLMPPAAKVLAGADPARADLVAKYLRSRLRSGPDTSLMTEAFVKQVNWEVGRARFAHYGDLVSVTALEPGELPTPYTHRFRARFKHVALTAMAAFKDDKLDLLGLSLE